MLETPPRTLHGHDHSFQERVVIKLRNQVKTLQTHNGPQIRNYTTCRAQANTLNNREQRLKTKIAMVENEWKYDAQNCNL